MFFDSWHDILQVVITGIATYLLLIFFLRISGKRTLSKWNAFDFIVTIAFGSTLAATILSKDVSIAEGAVALALLISLQYMVTWASVRWGWVRSLVKAEPILLVYHGRYNEEVLRSERVSKEEVQAAVRAAGVASVHRVEAVVLETDGNFSVIKDLENPASALEGVLGFKEVSARYAPDAADRTAPTRSASPGP